MSRRQYNLPPLTTLSAFEAAARHQSFKHAAAELNVTPGAVSHQIRALERDLAVPLFHRVHRGIVLTDAGDSLFRAVRGSFVDISEALARLRSGPEDAAVTIGASHAMSALWLTPAISRFWQSHPEVRVNQVVADTLDLSSAVHDLVISYGPVEDTLFSGAPLFRDVLAPVGTPALAAGLQGDGLEALAAMPLVHLDAPGLGWTTWERWFAEMGFAGPLRRGVRVNNYMIALQAGQNGRGMVLGWQKLVAPLLETGALVPIGGHSLAAPTAFFLSSARHSRDAAGAALLRDWLIEEALAF